MGMLKQMNQTIRIIFTLYVYYNYMSDSSLGHCIETV